MFFKQWLADVDMEAAETLGRECKELKKSNATNNKRSHDPTNSVMTMGKQHYSDYSAPFTTTRLKKDTTPITSVANKQAGHPAVEKPFVFGLLLPVESPAGFYNSRNVSKP